MVVILLLSILFFFSSRRRHTRLQGDWSSDVCSSDLIPSLLHKTRSATEAVSAMRKRGRSKAIDLQWTIGQRDRKSTRLNSSHLVISYAVFCLKKKKNICTVNILGQRQRVWYNYTSAG